MVLMRDALGYGESSGMVGSMFPARSAFSHWACAGVMVFITVACGYWDHGVSFRGASATEFWRIECFLTRYPPYASEAPEALLF